MDPVIENRLSELGLLDQGFEIKELDVRPILEQKGEPYNLIMDTYRQIGKGGVLILHTTFKPLPLIGVFKAKGYLSDSLQLEKKHHVTLFYPKR